MSRQLSSATPILNGHQVNGAARLVMNRTARWKRGTGLVGYASIGAMAALLSACARRERSRSARRSSSRQRCSCEAEE